MKIEINLRDIEITRVHAGNDYAIFSKETPLDSMYVTLKVNGFTKHVTLNDKYFRIAMDAIRQQVIEEIEDKL